MTYYSDLATGPCRDAGQNRTPLILFYHSPLFRITIGRLISRSPTLGTQRSCSLFLRINNKLSDQNYIFNLKRP